MKCRSTDPAKVCTVATVILCVLNAVFSKSGGATVIFSNQTVKKDKILADLRMYNFYVLNDEILADVHNFYAI